LQAGGGTHVANTREVGGIRVTGYESKGRINKRIRIARVDGQARRSAALTAHRRLPVVLCAPSWAGRRTTPVAGATDIVANRTGAEE